MARRRRGEETLIVMHKGNRDVEANMLKTMAMCVLMRFVARVREDAVVMEDDNTLMLTIPATEDDPEWVYANVIRYVDILGATTGEQIERKVDKLVERFGSLPDASPDKVGEGIVIRHLKQFYLIEKSASIFRRGVE